MLPVKQNIVIQMYFRCTAYLGLNHFCWSLIYMYSKRFPKHISRHWHYPWTSTLSTNIILVWYDSPDRYAEFQIYDLIWHVTDSRILQMSIQQADTWSGFYTHQTWVKSYICDLPLFVRFLPVTTPKLNPDTLTNIWHV